MTNLLVRSAIVASLSLSLTACFDSDDNDAPVLPVNSAPQANNAMFTTQADIVISDAVTASDADGDALIFALDVNGVLGSAVINTDGSFTYTPNAQVTGSDTFTFTVSDGNNAEVTGEVMITIEAKQVSFTRYTRDAFNQAPTDEPLPLNGRAFTQDATDASFDDLLIDQ